MKKKWIQKPLGDEQTINELSSILKVNPIISNLLAQRGITTFEAAKAFFNPSLNNLHDPFLMKDMEKAVERLEKALNSQEKILIYGDYDVDGTTAVALLIRFLKKHTDQLGYYIPDRETEGYGISFKGIDHAIENNFTLIISLDCGIKAVDKVKYAKEKDIDFIICDHHLPDTEIPDAVAVLDPKQNGCEYPYKELSGCGVGFKLLHAYTLKNNLDIKELYHFLDLVSVSIASDIVPITGENRILSFFGLRLLNKKPSVGLKALIDQSGINKKELSINDLVFVIGPRINAAGRMGTGNTAVELLVSEDTDKAKEIAEHINSFNSERKETDKIITQNALSMIESTPELIDKAATVLYNPEWHKGVIGIVASRLLEHYYRPTVLLTKSNGLVTGSARSVEGFDLYSAIESCSDLLEGYGGHTHAAGLSLKLENLKAFIERFEKYVSEHIQPENLIPKINIDAEIKLREVGPRLYHLINKFSPFGPGNMRPIFQTQNVMDIGWSRKVGQNEEHLKIDIREEGNPYRYSGICFNQADSYDIVKSGNPFKICYIIDENNYKGRKTIQLRVKDIQE